MLKLSIILLFFFKTNADCEISIGFFINNKKSYLEIWLIQKIVVTLHHQ